jgi:hypothetical protein
MDLLCVASITTAVNIVLIEKRALFVARHFLSFGHSKKKLLYIFVLLKVLYKMFHFLEHKFFDLVAPLTEDFAFFCRDQIDPLSCTRKSERIDKRDATCGSVSFHQQLQEPIDLLPVDFFFRHCRN